MIRIDTCATVLKITEQMDEKNISVKEIQRACGCSHQAVYSWLKMKSFPSMENLLILADLFEIGIEDLIVAERDE